MGLDGTHFLGADASSGSGLIPGIVSMGSLGQTILSAEITHLTILSPFAISDGFAYQAENPRPSK